MRALTRGGRPYALAALGVAVLVVLLITAGGGPDYTVNLRFQDAGQLVKGDYVDVAGVPVGQVRSISLTPDGLADVEISVNKPYSPLRSGTRAIVRQTSLTGVANRYVELQLPPFDAHSETIPDGGTIGVERTTAIVDLDQLLATFDSPTRKALRGFITGSAHQYEGQTAAANRGLEYLSPSLSTSSAVFREATSDTAALEGFLDRSARLVTAVAQRGNDLEGIIHEFNITTGALGDERVPLAESLRRLPGFMRQANTTFVDLRSALDDFQPLVDASKPVLTRLQPFLPEADALERDAVPTVTDLAAVVRRPGKANDLTELVRSFGPVARVALDRRELNGAKRDGAIPETAKALTGSTPAIAQGRPYTPDFFGWLDDFSTTGGNDALGAYSRAHTYVNAFTPVGGFPQLLPLDQRGADLKAFAKLGQYKRCPGASEIPAPDGSNVWSEAEQKQLDCRESDRATLP
jgi:phospholipid/cholesterol/gamma-HCH transport system substrate-binding protein